MGANRGSSVGGSVKEHMGSVWTIVVAAGSGSRFGRPKQYQPLGDRRVLDWSLRAARTASDGVVLVVPSDQATDPEPLADAVTTGDATRSGSVRSGLAAVPTSAEVVVVHDGARPLATADLFDTVVAEVRAGAAAALPTVPITDTVRSRSGGMVDRADLVLVQTPQAFRPSALRAAHASLPEATDDASLVEAHGGHVVLVPGAPTNLKITYPTDLLLAEALLPGVTFDEARLRREMRRSP
jgi:2-C-methyl-D-erythritol 4-phosphate cytidylyltransferase